MVLFPVLFESVRHKLACVEVAWLANHAFGKPDEFLFVLKHPVKVYLTYVYSFETTIVFFCYELLDFVFLRNAAVAAISHQT